jgi:putative Holliday junction resolvase
MSSPHRVSPPPAAAKAERILAIDYGRRRIGLAISDPASLTARPLATLERVNRRDDLRRLRETAREHGVRRILVGNPVHLDGSPSEMAAEAAAFARRVEKSLGLPVELVDERLSSWEAGEIIAEQSRPRSARRAKSAKAETPGGARKKKVPPTLDAVAAAVILRDYLEHEHTLSAAAKKPPARAADAESRRARTGAARRPKI